MPDYQVLYVMLFHTVTDAIGQLEAQNFGAAKEMLQQAKEAGERACFPNAEKNGVYDCFRDPAFLPREKKSQ